MSVCSVPAARSSVRAWARDLATRPAPPESRASCRACGLVVTSGRSLEEHAALLLNVGWRVTQAGLSCPECVDGVVRRVVTGSKGDRYVLRHVGGAWRCSCRGYSYRGRCSHAAALEAETKEKARLATLALEAETKERARLAALARDFLNEAEPGATVYASDFLAWLGDDPSKVSVEGARAVLASALEGYRRVCDQCDGQGGETHIVGGWDEPITEGHRCGHCDGEGELEPPHLAPLEDAMPIAAE